MSLTKKHKIVIGVLASLLLTLLLIPGLTKIKTQRTINGRANELANIYNAEGPYDLGSISTCSKQGPSSFGQISGLHVCSVVSAKLFYIDIEVDEYRQLSSEPLETRQLVRYVDKAGDDPSDSNFHEYILSLNPGEWNTTDYSYVTSKYEIPNETALHDVWFWHSTSDWSDTAYHDYEELGELFSSVNSKIFGEQAPATDAQTVKAALDQGKAPLVVYYTNRYCHSPSAPVLDKFCILPN